MQFHRDSSAEANIIKACGSDSIQIGEQTLARSCIVSPTEVVEDWPVDAIAQLATDHLQPVIALKPELILLGAGSTLRFPSPAIMASVTDAGIGLEVMDTPAACRTYNVLIHEGRHVVAALILDPAPT